MALQFTSSTDKIDPESLYGLLSKKSLLPDQFLDPNVLGAISRVIDFGIIHDGGEVIAFILTYPMDHGVLGMTLVKERGRFDRRRDELKALAPTIWSYLFRDEATRRVDCRPPVSHVQTGRMLDCFGFKRETNMLGVRDAMLINHFPTALHIWGLLRHEVVDGLNAKMPVEALADAG